MSRCFLSYSQAYRPVMELIRRLLETLEFDVDLFDGPDLSRPPITVAQQKILASDCTVVILGPLTFDPGRQECEPAPWPVEEALYAVAREKPAAIFVHPGTRVPESIRQMQTPARFSFCDSEDLLKNMHNIVKHLLDLKRRVDLPPGNQPFVFTKGVARNRFLPGGVLLLDVYHEAVARNPWERFTHEIDAGSDRRSSVVMSLLADDAYEIEASLNPGRHAVAIEFGEISNRQIPYFVAVSPPLSPGERLGYRRRFHLKNWFPLSAADLRNAASEEGFPSIYRIDGRIYYGDVWDVRFEMDSLKVAFHFPRKLRLRSQRAVVYSMLSDTRNPVNPIETERCNTSDCLNLDDSPDAAERVLSLTVRRPLINHQYGLLYEPEE